MDPTTQKPREVTLAITLEGRGSFSGSGPDDLVFRGLAEFKEVIAETPASRAPAPRQVGERPAPRDGDRPERLAGEAANVPPIGPFVRSKAPKTNPQAVAVVAVWDNWRNGTTDFTIESIGVLWRTSGRKPASNLSRDVGVAAREGWLENTGRGHFVTTAFGVDYVRGLPAKAPVTPG